MEIQFTIPISGNRRSQTGCVAGRLERTLAPLVPKAGTWLSLKENHGLTPRLTSSSPSTPSSSSEAPGRGTTHRFALESRARHTRRSSTRARTGCSTCKPLAHLSLPPVPSAVVPMRLEALPHLQLLTLTRARQVSRSISAVVHTSHSAGWTDGFSPKATPTSVCPKTPPLTDLSPGSAMSSATRRGPRASTASNGEATATRTVTKVARQTLAQARPPRPRAASYRWQGRARHS